MKFSIITPSLQRESLLKCCQSVNDQTFTDWEHIIALDVAEVNNRMFNQINHQQRFVYQCDYPHRNFGNTCRHKAWEHATGDYVLYLDDDNYFAHPAVLQDILIGLESCDFPDWGLFPILRYREKFFFDPPEVTQVDTANVVVKREIGQWPDGPEYEKDGLWIKELVKRPYAAFPRFNPIVVVPESRHGQ